METARRQIAKAVSWQTMGLATMTVIGYLLTGSVDVAGSFAVISAAVGLVAFVLHERLWARISWGLLQDDGRARLRRTASKDGPRGLRQV